jgi:murein DD-endopeptidase MepM/ murein hydrolase activator NlpD
MTWTLRRRLRLPRLSRRGGSRLAALAALALALTSVLPAPRALAQTGQPAGPEYIIEAGDTLFAIAAEFGTSVDALTQANPGLDPNALSVGTRLIIPGFEEFGGATLRIREVALGEALASIARGLGVPVGELMRLNRIVHPQTVYLGQPLVYPDGAAPAGPAQRAAVLGAGGVLSAAAAHGASPWAAAALSEFSSPVLTLPGAIAYVPVSEAAGAPGLPAPLTTISLDPPAAVQGRTMTIRVEASRPVTLSGTLSLFGALAPPPEWSPHACLYPTKTLHFAPQGNGGVALQGVCALAPAGAIELTIQAADSTGATAAFSQLVPLREGDYGQESLEVPSETLDPAIIQREVDAIRAVATGFSPDRMWTGVFQRPSELGEYRSYFGTRRSYNGGPFDSYHAGLDFSGQVGTPILAPAPGIVVLAEPDFIVYGGLTFIDHGWGVYTGYLHQSQLNVAVGDRVETGQVIGLVGNTGRVTGPHLHWEIWSGGVPVDPQEWLDRPIGQ